MIIPAKNKKQKISKAISNYIDSFSKAEHGLDEMMMTEEERKKKKKKMMESKEGMFKNKFNKKIVQKLLEIMERRKAQMISNLGHVENV